MKLVYICSPYAGDIEKNVRFARAACLYAAEHGCAPVAAHLLYPQLLDDAIPAQRELGIRMGLRVMASCEELWICGERISHGMSCEIAEAERLGIPVIRLSTEQIQEGYQIKLLSDHPKEGEIKQEETPSSCLKLQLCPHR